VVQRLVDVLHLRSIPAQLSRIAAAHTHAALDDESTAVSWPSRVLGGAAIVGVLAISQGLVFGRTETAGANTLQSQVAIERFTIPVSAEPVHITVEKTGQVIQSSLSSLAAASGTENAVAAALSTEIAAVPRAEEAPATASEASTETTSAPTEQAAAPESHTVRAGDTIDKIAARYGLTPEQIVQANDLVSANHIQVGQRLRLSEKAPAASIGRRPAASSEEAFIESLAKGAQESQRITGVPSSVTLAQAILETYWGSSFLAREANNYFGIKAYAKPGSAGVVWIDAWEVDGDGRNVTTQEPFRRYNDPAESLVDHGKFFIENSRYGNAMQATDDPREFARRINRAGYATDPAYASKLISYMDRYNLYQWDIAS